MKKRLIVTSIGATFRRAGIRFTKQETILNVDDLKPEQVAAIRAEKNLIVIESEIAEDKIPPANSNPDAGGDDAGSDDTNDGTNHDTNLIDKLVAAIGQLETDNTEHFTTKGIPQLDALAAIVGEKVTAKQRDEAFTAFSAQQLQPVQPTDK